MADAATLAHREHPGSGAIRLEAHDDAGEVAKGIDVAAQLAARPEVVTVVGHYNSNVTLEAAAIYGRAGLPLMAPIVSNPALTDRRTGPVFRYTNRDDRTAAALVVRLRALRKRTALVVATTTTYGASMATQFVRAFERAGGQVAVYLTVDEGRSDFDDLLAGIDPGDVDVVFYGGTFEGAPLLRQLRARGLGQLFATGDGCWDVENFVAPAGAAAEAGEGVLVLSATPAPTDADGSADVIRRYEAAFRPANNYAVNSYEATRIVLRAIDSALQAEATAGTATRAAVAVAVAATPLPTATWDDRGDNRAAVTALHVVREGRFHQVAITPNR
jgi:branched-chain amino acid transport system substrate-binding protein